MASNRIGYDALYNHTQLMNISHGSPHREQLFVFYLVFSNFKVTPGLLANQAQPLPYRYLPRPHP